MTGVERALRALSFEPIDRAPVAGGLLANGPLLARIAGVDDFWADPLPTAFEAFRRLGCDVILGPVIPRPPEQTTQDAQGRATSFHRREVEAQLTRPEQVAEYARNATSPEVLRREFDFQAAYDEYLAVSLERQKLCPDMLLIPHCLGYAPEFPTSDGHFSYAAFLMACAQHTDDMAVLFESWGERSRLRMEAVAAGIVDRDLPRVLWTGTDLCDARSSVLSPALLERLYFPALSRAIEPLKQAGIRVVWHADANYRRILPRMIELGIDGFQGFYETEGGITLEWLSGLRALSGDPLLLFGSVSTVWTLPHGTLGDVRRDVDRCMAVGKKGGLILAPSSSIGPETPDENVLEMHRWAVGR